MTINELIKLDHPKINILLDKYFNKNTSFKLSKGDYFYEPTAGVYAKVKNVKLEVNSNSIKVRVYYNIASFCYQEDISDVSSYEKNILTSANADIVTIEEFEKLKEEYEESLPF